MKTSVCAPGISILVLASIANSDSRAYLVCLAALHLQMTVRQLLVTRLGNETVVVRFMKKTLDCISMDKRLSWPSLTEGKI